MKDLGLLIYLWCLKKKESSKLSFSDIFVLAYVLCSIEILLKLNNAVIFGCYIILKQFKFGLNQSCHK